MSSGPIQLTRHEAEQLEIRAWDRIASRRAADLDANRDPSYTHVLMPTIRELLGRNSKNVLDAGCGVGRLTAELAQRARTVVGIEPSVVSADLARRHVRSKSNVRIHDLTIQQYAGLGYGGHDACVALMVLQDVVDLSSFLCSARSVLEPGGRLIAAVTHPKYWPKYWRYEAEPWFDYSREIFIRSEFRTSLSESGVSTLHVHRPIAMYESGLAEAGFRDIRSWEPMMPRAVQKQAGVDWLYPHFWFVQAQV